MRKWQLNSPALPPTEPHPPSASVGSKVVTGIQNSGTFACAAVTRHIASYFAINTGLAAAKVDVSMHGCQASDAEFAVSKRDYLREYFAGAGTAINPLPIDRPQFHTSDIEALHSDWEVALSDVETVWLTVSEINRKIGEILGDDKSSARRGTSTAYKRRSAEHSEFEPKT